MELTPEEKRRWQEAYRRNKEAKRRRFLQDGPSTIEHPPTPTVRGRTRRPTQTRVCHMRRK